MTQWNSPPGDPYGRQPGYGQPGYGQPGYGQPGYEQGYRYPQGYGPGGPVGPVVPAESFGIAGTVMALLGGIVVIVALTGLEWFGSPSLSFGDVGNLLSGRSNANGFADAYFGWLAWLFLVVVVIAGVLSSVPTPALRVFRIIGTVVGFAAAGLSFLALQLSDNESYLTYLKHARIGFYLAIIGFLVAGIGAAIGPRRV